jgi:hypothetical protein
VRADLLEKAAEQSVDISKLCNRALATTVGIDYDPREKKHVTARKPVIIADEPAPVVLPPPIPVPQPAPGPGGHLHPVINADDPAAVTSVKRIVRTPVVKPVAAVPVVPRESIQVVTASPSVTPAKVRTSKSLQKKKRTAPDLKKFVSETILREDAENASITKEALYLAFDRWCRERRIVTVPDRKNLNVALKNQFALTEKVVDGEPSWVNVRLK